MKKKQIIGLIISLISFFSILFYPSINGLTNEGQRCLAIFIMVFFLYAFEVFNVALTSLMIVPMLVILDVLPVTMALKGFSSTSTYLIIGAFIITGAMIKSRLGDRIGYKLLTIVGTKTINISLGIVLISVIMSFLIPSSTARTAMLLPLCLSIIEQANKQTEGKNTKFAANILMSLCCINSTISAGIMTATITNPMAVESIENATGIHISYLRWLLWGGPIAIVATILAFILIQLVFKSELKQIPGGTNYAKSQLASMGKITTSEYKVIVVLILAIVLWFVGDMINIDSCTTCLLCACILCLPKVGILEWKDVNNSVSLNIVFLVSGGISLGIAMSETKTAVWLAESIFNLLHLDRFSSFMMLVLIIIIIQFMHIFFAGTATMANVFFPIVLGIATVANMSPVLLIMVSAFMIGGFPILMFFNTTPNVICYNTGYLKASDFIKFGTMLSIVAIIVYTLAARYYWPLVGLN